MGEKRRHRKPRLDLLLAGMAIAVVVAGFLFISPLYAGGSSGYVTVQTDNEASMLKAAERAGIGVWRTAPFATEELVKILGMCRAFYEEVGMGGGGVNLIGFAKRETGGVKLFCITDAPTSRDYAERICSTEGKAVVLVRPETRIIVCGPILATPGTT